MHRSRLQVVLIDHPKSTADSGRKFWGAALDVAPQPVDGGPYARLVTLGTGVNLEHQRLDDESPARVHLDIETDDVDAEVQRLQNLGATVGSEQKGWWQMRDPAGLVFCVVPVQSDNFNAHATTWSDDPETSS